MEISEPAFPLSPAAFKAALASGHGRAMIHARQHGLQGFEDMILEAMRYSWVFDTQCNGCAEPWLAELCRIAGRVEQFIDDDAEEASDHLRCGLLKEFVLMGYEQARPALYAAFHRDCVEHGFAGAREIVELDGEAGFLHVVRKIGELLKTGLEGQVDNALIELLDSQVVQGRGLELLEEGCRSDPAIAAYYWDFQRYLKRVSSYVTPSRPAPSLAEMIERIHLGGKEIHEANAWGMAATLEEREQVAAMDFRRLPDVGLRNYLRYFSRTGFPVLHDEHMELLKHPDEGVRRNLATVLSRYADERVRQAALQALADGELDLSLKLFRKSVRKEDLSLILDVVNSPATHEDIHLLHGTCGGLLDLMEGEGRDLRVALWVYEHSPCMICREGAVKVMRELPDFPAWVARECLHDAREEIRSVVAA